MLHRFLLTILPSPALSAEVDRMKALVHERVGSFSGRNTVPHITLFFADLPLECEGDICEGIARGVIGHKGFVLHYKGITYFGDKRTIYKTDHPHLTIAAGLKPAQFDKAWELLAPHVSHPAFSGEHRSEERVTEVVLLQRPLRAGGQYEPVRSFPLM